MVSLTPPMVNAIDARVAGSAPPGMMQAVGADTNRPPSMIVSAPIVPPALAVALMFASRGRNPEKSTVGLLIAPTVPLPPVEVTFGGSATLPQPPPPATTEALLMLCNTTGSMTAELPAPEAVKVKALIVASGEPL